MAVQNEHMLFPNTETTGQYVWASLNYLFLTIGMLLSSFGLGVDWQYLALAGGSSIIGSMLLQYTQREKNRAERLFKGIASTAAGIVFGSAAVTHWDVLRPGYIGAIFCTASMCSLIFAQAVVRFFEQNAGAIITDSFVFIFDRFRGGKSYHRRRATRHTMPRVVPDDTDRNDDKEGL